MGKKRGFHLSARQGYNRELLSGSQAPGPTWGTTRSAVPPAQRTGHPLGTDSKGPGVAPWSVFRGHWRQSNSLGSYRVRFLSSTLSCATALEESTAGRDYRTMESEWFALAGTFKNHLIPTSPRGQGHLPLSPVA